MKQRLDRSRHSPNWRLHTHNSLLSGGEKACDQHQYQYIFSWRESQLIQSMRRTDTPPVKFCEPGVLAAGGTNVQSIHRFGSVGGKKEGRGGIRGTYWSQYGKSLGYEHCREHLCMERKVSSSITRRHQRKVDVFKDIDFALPRPVVATD